MDELTAVKLSQAGNKAAFGVLIDNNYKNVYRYAYQFIGNHQDADDICQETFLRAFDNIGTLKDGKRFKEWIFKIASNLSRKCIKKVKLNKKMISTSADSLDKLYENNETQPFENLSEKEKTVIIQKQIQKMPEHLRMVTVLVLMENITQKEAAEILNRSEPTISRDLNNAKNWLRNKLRNLI